ncbi:MAG TPA: EAL domain-containing protein, partial [Bacilli bacterium]|nr:EAL domain-containing protein [Bacilli bacterium]
ATGYAKAEVIGRNPSLMQSGWHNRDFYKTMWDKISTEGEWQGEVWNRRKSGEVYPQWLHIRSVCTGRPDEGTLTRYVALFRDITDRKADEERLHHQATHDALTGLPNRLLFLDRLQSAAQDAKRLDLFAAVMFLDLDRFKIINDTMGHNLGDKLLQQVATRLPNCLGEQDSLCRLGGDEFAILLEKLETPNVAVDRAQSLLDAFLQPFELEGQEFFLTPSIGIALSPSDGTEVEELVKNADSAMYRAKESGNNYQFYTPMMNAKSFERLTLEQELRKALLQQEFVLHYQPQVALESGKLIGMEALLRWQHPTRGLVSPALFIPLLEENGLIVPVGEWALRTACRQNKLWLDDGYDLHVAVNLSARQFAQQNLVETVKRVLEETGLPASHLDLEITESIAMEDNSRAVRTMQELNELGVGISIDDFGTGYSSLSYLKKFPIQTLKIDKSFVDQIAHDQDDVAIAASIIALGKALRLKVVAEGVETEEQFALLREMGCDKMQGFHYSRPLPPEQFETLLAQIR